MDNIVLVAIISGLFTAIPTVITTILSNSKHNAIIDYRMDKIEEKQDKHNNLIERTYKLESEVKVLKESIKD